MSCANPIEAAILADYWFAALPSSAEEQVEEHLFECDECGARLGEVMALGESIRALARAGALTMVVSDAFLRRVQEQGLRVREYAPPQNGRVECTVGVEDDFLVGRLAADLRSACRVDLSLCDPRGNEFYRMADIPFRAEASNVAFQQSITYAKAAASGSMTARLFAYDEAGTERLLGEYMFNHTRTLPGPGIPQ
jgi:hypothetical protein